jgi:FkbM family methyltransferase
MKLATAPCRYGQMVWPAADTTIGRCLELYREFSEHEVEVFRGFVQPGDFVLDVGANIGCHTVALANLVGRGGLVYAFEPQGPLCDILETNVEACGVRDVVRVANFALGSRSGRCQMPPIDYGAERNSFGTLSLVAHGLEPQPHWPGCAVDTIDNLAMERPVAFIKIDVEGLERGVMLQWQISDWAAEKDRWEWAICARVRAGERVAPVAWPRQAECERAGACVR